METRIRRSIEELGPWFHNLHLPGDVQTAPDHFLGDFPLRKWVQIEPFIPADLSGWSVLDIGCNAGFYSFELAKRGADVLGIDSDSRYLKQAIWASSQLDLPRQPRFEQMQVHDLASLDEEFDLVLFMGVFYHLRYPTLALDTVSLKVKRLMIFQTLTMAGFEVEKPLPDYPITERAMFDRPGWPKMAFIEKKYSGDPTNWWVPNHAAIEAMLRSSGFATIQRMAHEIYFCSTPEHGVAAKQKWDHAEWKSATGAADARRSEK
jgi:tRNA (mo5U34)-methyltransferase